MPAQLHRQRVRRAMDLELKVSELLLEPYAASQEWNEVAVHTEKKMYHIRLRVPNGLDQEFVAERAWMNVTDAENLLLQRCVESVSAEVLLAADMDRMAARTSSMKLAENSAKSTRKPKSFCRCDVLLAGRRSPANLMRARISITNCADTFLISTAKCTRWRAPITGAKRKY